MSGAPNTDTGVTPPPVTSPSDPGTDWISTLPPELKQVVEVKGYKTPADVVQGYANAQKAIGADKILLPNKDTGEWDAEARVKLGVPVDPTGYKIERPTNLPAGMAYDEGFEKAALPVAHKLGLTPHQVKGLMDFYATYQGEAFKGMTVEATKSLEGAQALLKKEWGTTFEAQAQRAQVAAKHFGGEALVNYLNATGMGNAPEVIRAFAKIGAQMTEDQLKVGQLSGFGLTPDQAKREAHKLMQTDAYQKSEHPEHEEVQAKVAALFAQAHPG